MPAMKKKPAPRKPIKRRVEGGPFLPKGAKPRKMNALDEAISQGKTLPSKNKKGSVPPDYDVIMPGMGYTKPTKKNPPKKIKKK